MLEHLKRLVRRRPRVVGEDRPAAPAPGDRVRFYRDEFEVSRVVTLAEGGERRLHLHLTDQDGRPALLVLEDDEARVTALLRQEDPADLAGEEPGMLRYEGESCRPSHHGRARAAGLGVCDYREYEDEDATVLILVERWAEEERTWAGRYVHRGELTIRSPDPISSPDRSPASSPTGSCD